MLVELAAFTAAAKTVTSAIQAGKELDHGRLEYRQDG